MKRGKSFSSSDLATSAKLSSMKTVVKGAESKIWNLYNILFIHKAAVFDPSWPETWEYVKDLDEHFLC